MAEHDHRQKSRPKTRKRSKSVSSKRSSHPYELIHSVSYTEKAETMKRKSKKELQTENIALDSAKQMLDKKLANVEKDHEILKLRYSHLEDQLEHCEGEKKKLADEKSILETELKNKNQDIHELKVENITLNGNLKTSEQNMSSLKTDFDTERRSLREQLTNERKEHMEFVHYFSKLLADNRANVYVTGSSKNVQVGGTNIVNEEIKAQWKELTDKLCLALEDHMVKRKELEMRLRNDEVLIKEMKDSVNKILKNMDSVTAARVKQDKKVLEFLVSDRSDERVFIDGIKKKYFAGPKRKNPLPFPADVAITRLLNKFDGLKCQRFVEILEGKKAQSDAQNADETMVKEVFSEETNSIQLQECEKEKPLNRRLCTDILAKWLNLSDENDVEQLLGRIKVYESKISAEMLLKYQREVQESKPPAEHNETRTGKEHTEDEVEIPYASLSKTQSLQGLPDALSQFMHQLEGLKIVLEIDKKVDKICTAMNIQDKEDSTETSL